jgi:hypothetical protein
LSTCKNVDKVCNGGSSSSSASTSSASDRKDATGRRSFSSSVDSGRSSDTGTLGGSDSDCSVKIVSHSFCDFLGGSSEKSSKKEKKPAAAPEMPTITSCGGGGGGGNKVTVFVPYSAISEYKNEARAEKQKHASSAVTDVFTDNVVICDTHVILRINCTTGSDDAQTVSPAEESAAEEGGGGGATEEDEDADKPHNLDKTAKGRRSRMSRRMTTTVAVYEMVNAARKNKHDALDEVEEESSSSSSAAGAAAERLDELSQNSMLPSSSSVQRSTTSPSRAAAPPRRKDLCKLLGLIECDITTDATSAEDIKVAQKVAIDNLLTAIKENQMRGKQQAPTEAAEAEEAEAEGDSATATVRPQVAKKDLAKFLGIEDAKDSPSAATATSASSSANQKHQRPKKKLVNWGQLMKHSMRWRPAEESPSRQQQQEQPHQQNASQFAHGLDFELPMQLKRVNEVIDCPPEVIMTPDMTAAGGASSNVARNSRKKNLNKFLGMDDSDSEEMVFISNRRNGPKASGGAGSSTIGGGSGAPGDVDDCYGNSLNRSDQGSSIVGIRIANADDLVFSSKSVEDCSERARASSSYSSSPSSTVSSRDSKQRPSLMNGFMRPRSAINQTSQLLSPPSRSAGGLHPTVGGERSLSLGSMSRHAEDEITIVGEDDDDDKDFSPPPRKSVLFKEYNFSVEESIAMGLPIIPSNNNTNTSSGSGSSSNLIQSRRKKKKDAERRSAEVGNSRSPAAAGQPHHQYFFSSSSSSMARSKSSSQTRVSRKKNTLEAYLQTSNHDWLLDTPSQTENNSGGGGGGGQQQQQRHKVARNTVVRSNDPIYLDMFRARQQQQQMAAAAAAHFHQFQQQQQLQQQQLLHHGSLVGPPRYLSCSPKGRVRAVKPRSYQHRQQEQHQFGGGGGRLQQEYFLQARE